MADIGSTLREARMRSRIDITEVEARTKIRAKYLRAMENEEWDLLPGPVYIKSFLRTYGDFLGLDSRLLIDDFKRRYERPADSEMRPVASIHRERERAVGGPVIPPWAIIGLVLVAVVVVLYILGSGNKAKSPSPTGTRGAPRHRPHRHRARPAPAAPAQNVRLQLTPTGSVYVCLVDETGRKLIPGKIFAAHQTIPLQTGRQLLLTLGNASVQMKVNGAPVHVPASSSSIGFSLRPGAVSSLPAARQPRCA